MGLKMGFILIHLWSVLSYATSIHPDKSMKSAKIIYDISGGGSLSKGDNLTFIGTEKFYMKDSGKVTVNHLKLLERIEGHIQSRVETNKIEKYEDGLMYDVDFNTQDITLSKAKKKTIDLEGFTNLGTLLVAEHNCTLWQDSTTKICLFDGIILFAQKSYLDYVYTKKAQFVLFDLNISDELFTLPDFPLKENNMLTKNMKITKLHDSKAMYQKILDSSKVNATKQLRYDFTKELVSTQKVDLNLLLNNMKEARECLSVASEQQSANACLDMLKQTVSNMTDTATIDIGLWTKETKNRILDYLEEHIFRLQGKSACIRRAQNIDDLSMCMGK